MVNTMEEPGEQHTVVFALIVTEPASEFVCVAGFITIYAKTTVNLFSRFLHGKYPVPSLDSFLSDSCYLHIIYIIL